MQIIRYLPTFIFKQVKYLLFSIGKHVYVGCVFHYFHNQITIYQIYVQFKNNQDWITFQTKEIMKDKQTKKSIQVFISSMLKIESERIYTKINNNLDYKNPFNSSNLKFRKYRDKIHSIYLGFKNKMRTIKHTRTSF